MKVFAYLLQFWLDAIVPTFFDWDPTTNQRVDRKLRPEISYGIVEYIAPQEYMVDIPVLNS